MKVLIYAGSSILNPQFGVQMERAIEYNNRGDEVVFCYCSGVMSSCSANIYHNKAFCKICKLSSILCLKNLPSSIKIKAFNKREDHSEYVYKRFGSLADIKKYRYKDVDLGFSVLSVYITKTMNPNPLISPTFLDGINKLLKEGEHLVDAAENLITLEEPDLIIFFNGRGFDSKPFCNLAQKYGINYIATEIFGGIRANSEYRMIKFKNTIPHDAKVAYQNCLDSWNASPKPESEKKEIGSSFYEKRRNAQQAGDYVYTGSQIQGKLPDSFNPQKKNVVVFISSEHEYSSVSPEVDGYFIFSSQYDAVKYISENINDDDFHFIVRIHPNMKGLDVEYHRNLYKLREKKNVTVIGPEESVSSYALIDIAYAVVVSGSTIGAESLYWGKPVVLLGFAAYYYWGCCSIPHKIEEVIGMIKNPQIYPGTKEMTIKYGYYILENSLGEKAKYINITPHKVKILGRYVYVFDYLKIFNSSKLYRYVYIFYTRFLSMFYKNRITIS